MAKYISTRLTHCKTRQRIKKQIGKIDKIHFTQQEALHIFDSGNLKPIYDAFSTFIFKEADRLAKGDAQGALSYYTNDFFADLYQEGLLNLTLALNRYDREKSDNLIGYCMAYVKGNMLRFKNRYCDSVLSNKSQQKNKTKREEQGWASVENFGSFDEVNFNYEKMIEKTYGNSDQKEYDETIIINYVLNNNHIFELTEKEIEAIIIYFDDDKTTLKNLAEQLNITLNKATYIYICAKNKIKKYKHLIQKEI